jgi:3-dehydroquinate dehydratase-1
LTKIVEPLLCTSVAADTPVELARKASLALSLGSDLVELRIDKLRGAPRGLGPELSALTQSAIITVRSSMEGGSFAGSEAERLDVISRLAETGPAYLDVELSTLKANEDWARSLPEEVERIVSWHDFRGTPPLEALRATCEEELGLGSLAKVVTTAGSVDDNLTTLTLCGDSPGKVISFCMGELGTVSRVVSMRMGAPLAYVCLPNEAVAPGQLSLPTMRELRSMVS